MLTWRTPIRALLAFQLLASGSLAAYAAAVPAPNRAPYTFAYTAPAKPAPTSLRFRAHAADLAAEPGRPPAPPVLQADWVDTGLTGAQIESARAVQMPAGDWAVEIAFNAEGKQRLAAVTRTLTGKPMGLFIDDKLLAAPTVRMVLDAGRMSIRASYDEAEARAVAEALIGGTEAGQLDTWTLTRVTDPLTQLASVDPYK